MSQRVSESEGGEVSNSVNCFRFAHPAEADLETRRWRPVRGGSLSELRWICETLACSIFGIRFLNGASLFMIFI